MSFQGDVRGIGLAELLQGLSRGRKEGLLTLTSQRGLRSVLGLGNGKVYLLPDEGDNSEFWRDRVRDAYAGDDAERVDLLRMGEIAKAGRLEILYQLLDGGGVHFRFEPADLPKGMEEGTSDAFDLPIQGTQIEFLLLEYARISDELTGFPETSELADDVIPVMLDKSIQTNAPARLVEQIDGSTTLRELADRIGWPIRQVRLGLGPLVRSGAARFAISDETLFLALSELRAKNYSRAAQRLNAWCRDGAPGPLHPDACEALANEWISGRLTAALKGLPAKRVRVLLRRMDHTLKNPSTAVVHWSEACRVSRSDRLSRLHKMAVEFAETNDEERPNVRELLDLARDFREADHPARSAPLLVMAAHKQPDTMALQLELGQGLLTAGREAEAGPWIVTAAQQMIDRGQSDRAVGPLRALIEADPRNRDARALLSRARRTTTGAKRLRKNLLVSLAGTTLLGSAAIVQVYRENVWNRKIQEVRQQLGDPMMAMVSLRENFGNDDHPDVAALRASIEEQQRLDEIVLRNGWLELYHEAQVEASKGDVVHALELIRALPLPPRLQLVQGNWPLRSDLYEGITVQLDKRLDDLGPVVEGLPVQLRGENNVHEEAQTLLAALTPKELKIEEVQSLKTQLELVQSKARGRKDEREKIINSRLGRETMAEQNRLLQQAQALVKSGDFGRALEVYDELLKLGGDDRVLSVLGPEIQDVERQHEAVLEARELATDGNHKKAIEILNENFEEPNLYSLPFEVTSFPNGATVVTSTGREFRTPFTMESQIGQEVSLTFTIEGSLPRKLSMSRPGNQFLILSRVPERAWKTDGRVDAIPVAVADDHVLVDRRGRLVRMGPNGETRWSRDLKRLDGIMRAPVFVPRRKGELLVVAEDGTAWMVDAESGELEGPWELGAPPTVGPTPTSRNVQLRLSDGRVALWDEGLRPRIERAESIENLLVDDSDYRFGSECGMQVLRRREANQGQSFTSRFNKAWTVDVEDEAFRIRHEDGEGYAVVRKGDWSYLAWEAPSARASEGRLWIADGAGVRAFVPTQQ
tara:strand:+ start:316 stop:3441 length:3126 start_codon:yes stop_codon:yes gene_type:complete